MDIQAIQNLVDLHNAIFSISKDVDYLANVKFDLQKMKKVDEDLKYVRELIEDKMIENTTIAKNKSLSTQKNTTQVDRL